MQKKKLFNPIIYLAIAMFLISTACVHKVIKLEITPEELSEKMINNPAFIENANGENFCWHARVGLDQFVENYKLTKNTKWLDAGVRYFDFLIGKMAADPDGYKGWIGVYGYDDNYWQDALVGDAILIEGILDFSVLVLEDNALKGKYVDKAKNYIEIAKRDFVEKWDKRGCWIDDGPYGGYIEYGKFLNKDNLKKWIEAPEELRTGISHPFNKQFDAARVCLRIYRITGDKFYRDRAEKICNLFNGKIGEGIFLITWNGRDPAKKATYKGAYKIRWTIGTGYREFPLNLVHFSIVNSV